MIARSVPVLLLAATLAAPATEPRIGKRIPKSDEAIHALNRLAFGPRPGDLEEVRRLGVKKWIERQLNPGQLQENPELQARLEPLRSLTMPQQELVKAYPPPQLVKAFAEGRLRMPEDPTRRAMIQRLINHDRQRQAIPDQAQNPSREMPARIAPQRAIARDLYEQKLYRAVYSNRQLQEVLVDFWFNHFNVYLDKGADRYLVTSYERDAIRPHVLGSFNDLLAATAGHPAMLFYLDNWQSVAPGSVRARSGRKLGLNENYARELLELHTLGVDGGYTQKDVIEVARCFTGWTIVEPYRRGEFKFNPRVHDRGEKRVLGVTIPAGGGQDDGVTVLKILARHPSTARFISTKLARRFVADDPPETLIRAMSDTFRKTDGDLKSVMRTMLRSRDFWSQASYKAKLKSPFEMAASALRTTGAGITTAASIVNRIADLGQPLYRKQEPTGYSDKSSDWVNSAGLVGRMNFALDLVQNKLPGVKFDTSRLQADPQELARRLIFTDISPQTRAAIDEAGGEQDQSVMAGLILGSPEFQRR